MERQELIDILTKDIYLPKADFVSIEDYILDYINATKKYYIIKKESEESCHLMDLHSITSNVTLFSIEIKPHSKQLIRLRVLDKNDTIINMLSDLRKEFIIKVFDAAEMLSNCTETYENYVQETRNLEYSDGRKIHIDLQESEYTINNEEATNIKNILQKMAAMQGIDFTLLKDVNFKLNFEAWLPNEPNK